MKSFKVNKTTFNTKMNRFYLKKPMKNLSFSNKFCFHSYGIWWDYQSINEFFKETHTAKTTHSAEEFYVTQIYKYLTIEEAFDPMRWRMDLNLKRTPKNRFVERGASSPSRFISAGIQFWLGFSTLFQYATTKSLVWTSYLHAIPKTVRKSWNFDNNISL